MRILQWQEVPYVPSFITGDEVHQKCTSLKACKAPVLFLTSLTYNIVCTYCEATKLHIDGVLHAIFPGLRRPGCEADHSPLCNAGLGMNGDASPLSHLSHLHGVYRDIFAFYPL
jgi:hypothetical protein